MAHDSEFQGKTFVVTGAAGNVGAAVVVELAARGANVVLVDRPQDALDKVVARLGSPERAMTLAGVNLTQKDEVARMVAAALERFGQIDGLINTVGGFRMGRVAEGGADLWDFMMDVNARVVLLTSAAVLPAMAARKSGRLVHIAAGAGLHGAAGLAAYSASKAAVFRIVESLAAEHRADGVTVNCIMPGTIDTPENRAAMPAADTSEWVAPAAIARAIALLLSADAGAVTGAAIPVIGVGPAA